MKNREREQAIRNIFENELLPLLRAKGHDYAGDGNSFGNLADFGWKGIVVRISDKYHRLKNFCKSESLSVSDETIEDTLKDMINYALLCLVLKRYEQSEKGRETTWHLGKKEE